MDPVNPNTAAILDSAGTSPMRPNTEWRGTSAEVSNSTPSGTPVVRTETSVVSEFLEPNSVELHSNAKGEVAFTIKVYKHDVEDAIDNAVEQYNRLARATKRNTLRLGALVIDTNKTSTTEATETSVEYEPGQEPKHKENIINKKKTAKVPKPVKDSDLESLTSKYIDVRLFGSRLRHYRRMKGISLTELAQHMGMSNVAVRDWELSNSPPPDEKTTQRLCELLGLTDKQSEKVATGREYTRKYVPFAPGNK